MPHIQYTNNFNYEFAVIVLLCVIIFCVLLGCCLSIRKMRNEQNYYH